MRLRACASTFAAGATTARCDDRLILSDLTRGEAVGRTPVPTVAADCDCTVVVVVIPGWGLRLVKVMISGSNSSASVVSSLADEEEGCPPCACGQAPSPASTVADEVS